MPVGNVPASKLQEGAQLLPKAPSEGQHGCSDHPEPPTEKPCAQTPARSAGCRAQPGGCGKPPPERPVGSTLTGRVETAAGAGKRHGRGRRGRCAAAILGLSRGVRGSGASGNFRPCERVVRAENGSRYTEVNKIGRLKKAQFLWSMAPFSAAVTLRRSCQWEVKSVSSVKEPFWQNRCLPEPSTSTCTTQQIQ